VIQFSSEFLHSWRQRTSDEVRQDLRHDLNGLQIVTRVLFSCALTLLVGLCAYLALRWAAGVYG
jgi:hypothetical protein